MKKISAALIASGLAILLIAASFGTKFSSPFTVIGDSNVSDLHVKGSGGGATDILLESSPAGLAVSGGSAYQFSGNGKFTGTFEIDKGLYFATNPVAANTLDASLGSQITNCSANPTISGIAGVVAGQQFSGVVGIFANGADRTVSITAANVHVYPSGTLISTNGSFAVLTYGGVGGSYTGMVFLAFP